MSKRKCVPIKIEMPDGSIVTGLGTGIPTEADRVKVRDALLEISAKRMDPKRAERKARTARRASCIWQDDGEGNQLCMNCGEPKRKHTVYGGGEE
jgi:hypothetical protein